MLPLSEYCNLIAPKFPRHTREFPVQNARMIWIVQSCPLHNFSSTLFLSNRSKTDRENRNTQQFLHRSLHILATPGYRIHRCGIDREVPYRKFLNIRTKFPIHSKTDTLRRRKRPLAQFFLCTLCRLFGVHKRINLTKS